MYRIDFHTHSQASPDGGLSRAQYDKAFKLKLLDCVAVTDHNRVDNAISLQRALGESRIIVGEEIMTTMGEIIGLFLQKPVLGGLSPSQAIKAIKEQNGIVYIPHPFETVRHGLDASTLDEIAGQVDIVEVHNGRAWLQNRGPDAVAWAQMHHKLRAASSDAHGWRGLGSGITRLEEIPTRESLLKLMQKAHLTARRPNLRSLFYPKLYSLSHKLRIGARD